MWMKRLSAKKVVTFDVSVDDDLTDVSLDMRDFSGGIILMPGTWTSASIGFKVAAESGDTPIPLYDKNGTLVQISSPSASQAYEIPSEVFACQFVWLWSQDGSGSNTAQAADRQMTVSLKS